MADQAITALPKKTYSGSSQIASTDYLLGIDSAEGYQMLIQDLGEYIINRVTASLAGSTQTLASAISALNSKIESTAAGYVPTISGNSTLEVGNIAFTYFRFGGMMLISGRFNLTNKGDGTGNLRISLPTGFKVTVGSVGSYGIITPDVGIENKAPYASMSMRGDTNADSIFVQYGAGSASIPYMQVGYHMIFAVVPVTKTV